MHNKQNQPVHKILAHDTIINKAQIMLNYYNNINDIERMIDWEHPFEEPLLLNQLPQYNIWDDTYDRNPWNNMNENQHQLPRDRPVKIEELSEDREEPTAYTSQPLLYRTVIDLFDSDNEKEILEEIDPQSPNNGNGDHRKKNETKKKKQQQRPG